MSRISIPHLKKNGKTVQLMVNGHPLIMLAGELHNSSAASIDDVREKFDRLARLNLNTVITPLSWELIEPEEGRYEFGLLDGIIDAARHRGLHIVFLWFGAWKNSKSSYVPGWVKTNPARFPRVQINKGKNTDILTPFAGELRAVETRAFTETMRRIGKLDAQDGVVLMVQVENEVGILGGPRDFSDAAEAAFAAKVPSRLMEYLQSNRATLLDEVRAALASGGHKEGGTWAEVFGADADEIFMAWHLASHIDRLAAAGRAEHDLPMYANAWLVQPGMPHAGQYPSGGPVSRMLDIWRAAAPHIDFLAPDIYLQTFKETCESYARSGNVLFIPEARGDARAASTAFYSIGQHAAIGFGPFAVDDLPEDHPLGESYALLKEMMPMVTECQARGTIAGFYQQDEKDTASVLMGGYRAHVQSGRALSAVGVPGGGILLMLGDGEFLAAGRNYYISFSTPDSDVSNMELLSVDEGTIRDGRWQHIRRLNGDETLHGRAIPLWNHLTVCRGKLNTAVAPVYHQAEWQFPE